MKPIRAMLWAALLCWSALAAGQTIKLAAPEVPTQFLTTAQVWYDAQADRTLSDWQQSFQHGADAAAVKPSAPGFAWVEASQRPLGRKAGALWVALDLDNPHAFTVRHLQVLPERLEQVDAWLLTGPNRTTAQPLGRAGLSVPLIERPLGGNAPAWEVSLPQGPSTVLLRIRSRSTLEPQIQLWLPGAHALHMRLEDLRHGLESGALALAALLALVFALWLREFTWVWYGGSCLSLLVYQACFSGQASLWLWPANPQWTLPALVLGVAGSHACTTLFFLRFIPAHHVSGWGRGLALGLAGISVFGLFLSWVVGYQTGIVFQEVSGLVLPAVLLWLAWRAWRRGDQPARLALLSFGLLSLASVVRTATLQGWFSHESWLTEWFFPLGGVLTPTVLMLAMADRIRVMGRQQALAAQENQNLLEKRIQDATQELTRARDEAQAATQFKQRFLSRVSHDLRTPLHALQGHAELARRALAQLPAPAMPEDAWKRLQESMRAIQHSGSDILQLSTELLELARGEAGQLRLKTAAVHLPTLIQEVADTAGWLARHQQNTLKMEVELVVPWVLMDADRTKQVLSNLLANACAATRNGVVTLGARSVPTGAGDTAQVEWWVKDTGRGIAPAALLRIFEPFEQLNGSSATGAAGLGLAIAQQWVKLMGTDIAVQSTPGVGSLFSWKMQVPVATAPTHTGPPDLDEPKEDSQPLQGHVLVVDDLESHRLLLQGQLQAMGLQISQASGGQAAARLLQETGSGAPAGSPDVFSPVDLVITDQDMPGGDGAWLLQWCRQNRPSLAVVGLSGTTQSSTPFDAFLLKPATLAQLRPILQRLLPPALDWAPLRQLAERGDGLGVDAWIAEHRQQLGTSPLALGVVKLGESLQLAALVRWLDKSDTAR